MQEYYMQLALEEAKSSFQRGEVPVGAVIVDRNNDEIITRSGNLVEELGDATAHAEMLVIRESSKVLGDKRLNDCDLYVTLEPCPMCAQAISFARIGRLYFGAYDVKGGGVDSGAKIFDASSCHHVPEVYGGIKETEAKNILQKFFKDKR